MQQWEYAVLINDADKKTQRFNGVESPYEPLNGVPAVLNELGQEGWEMVAADIGRAMYEATVFVFKRPLPAT